MDEAILYKTKVIARDILAGTVAGIVVTLSGHPFDTLKVRLQTQPTSPPLYKGLIDCFTKTLKWEGIGGLYKGVMSPITGQVLFRAALFLSFAEAKRQLARHYGRPNTISDFYIAGALAWGIGTSIECPIDLLKSQMQVQIIKSKTVPGYVNPYKNLLDCGLQILRLNGLRGLYQGLTPHLMRNIPAGAVHLGTFELIRQIFATKQGIVPAQLPTSQTLFAGAVGGFLFWFLFFPFDVMKSSLQTDSINPEKRKFRGVVDCARQLYSDGGWRRFYKGFSPCLLRSVPANALMLYTVAAITEKIKVAHPSE